MEFIKDENLDSYTFTHKGNEYKLHCDADYANPYGISFPNGEYIERINNGRARNLWNKIKPLFEAYKAGLIPSYT